MQSHPVCPNHITSKNIPAEDIMNSMNEFQYQIVKQVSNYKNKIIGLLVKPYPEHEHEYYVPTLPSKRIRNLPVAYMDQLSWAPYESTKNFLNRLSARIRRFDFVQTYYAY